MKKSTSNKIQTSIKEITEHYFSFREFFENETQGNKNLIPTITIIKRFFEDGRKIETEYLMDGEPDYKTIYKYNERNQLIETIDILPSGVSRNKSIFKYDLNGLTTETVVYYDMENMDFIIEYAYDGKRQLRSESLTHQNHEEDVITFYEYRNDGRELIVTSKDRFGKIFGKTIEFNNEKGNLVLCKGFDGGDVLEQESFYEYDDWNNLLTRVIKCYSNSSLVEQYQNKYEYVFDEEKNWIRKIWFADNEEFSSVTIREIDYY